MQLPKSVQIIYFNSIKVRLEHISGIPVYIIIHNFNSIKVRLERALISNTLAKINFNSIKVRLEQANIFRYYIINSFQFHKGAIRTYVGQITPHPPVLFQFHKGAIRTYYYFLFWLIIIIFQFHKGAIRTI